MAGSGSGLKDFPYTIGEPYASAWGSWTHHRGASKDDGSPVSIFVLSGSSREDMHLVAGQNGVKRLRTLSHQDILSCLHSAEIEVSDDTSALQHKIYVVTEPVAPLAEKIKEMNLGGTPRDQYFARGLHQLSKALSYLNNDCKLVHGNISLASVVVTESLDWKLYAFDVLSEFDANNEAVHSPILKFQFLVENQYKAMELANLDWPSIRKSPPWAIDSWGLGCLIYELFSGGKLTRTEDLHKITSIPKSLFPDYRKLLSSTPSHRMNPSEFVHNSEFFLNYLVETIQFNKDGNLDSPSPSGSTGSPKRKWVSTKASGETTVADISKNDPCSKNFGTYPLSEFQRTPSKRRKYTNMSGLSSNDVGHSVLVRGWLQSIKAFGKNLTFLILRDGLSTLQCLLFGDHPGVCADMVAYVKNIAKESFVDIQGTVMLNPKTNKIELHIEKLFVITKASCPLPLQLEDAARGANEKDKRGNTRPQVELTSRLDKRCIDLRTDVTQSIFKIRSAVEQVFAMSMWNSGFTSIGTPKITPGISEGGSAVFDLKYINGKPASLAQSPQLYKQMAINGGMNKVFEIGPVFRAEKSDTTRHLCEYTAMHAEMEVENDYHEVVDLVGTTFVNIFDHLINNCANLLKNVRRQYPSEELKYLRKTLKLKYIEGIAMLKDSGFPIDEFDDLSRSAERKLGQLVLEKYKTEFFILYEYPLSLRPFYTMPSVEQRYSNAFDAFLRGEEILSGSQRIHVKDILTKRAEACGLNMKSLEFFFESFEFGAPPRGGFGAGLERVVMLFLDLPNIRLASLFPRDPVRLSP